MNSLTTLKWKAVLAMVACQSSVLCSSFGFVTLWTACLPFFMVYSGVQWTGQLGFGSANTSRDIIGLQTGEENLNAIWSSI